MTEKEFNEKKFMVLNEEELMLFLGDEEFEAEMRDKGIESILGEDEITLCACCDTDLVILRSDLKPYIIIGGDFICEDCIDEELLDKRIINNLKEEISYSEKIVKLLDGWNSSEVSLKREDSLEDEAVEYIRNKGIDGEDVVLLNIGDDTDFISEDTNFKIFWR